MTKEDKRESGEAIPKINDYLKIRRLFERMKKTDEMLERIGRIKTSLEKVPGIRYAFIYDSFVENLEDHEPEVDIIVLGGPDLGEMDEVISKAEEKLGRPFLITSFTVREFQERIKVKDQAILRAVQGPKIMLIGDEKELRRL
jgi:hypothetical protein